MTMNVVVMTDAEVEMMQALIKWATSPNIPKDKYDQGYEEARGTVCRILGIPQKAPVEDNGLVHG